MERLSDGLVRSEVRLLQLPVRLLADTLAAYPLKTSEVWRLQLRVSGFELRGDHGDVLAAKSETVR